MTIEILIVTFIAGLGAGLGTGFAGMSAAAVITPMLITFLDVQPYMAVGIALASDVLASAVSTYIYKKHNNVDVKNGFLILITVILFTFLGSYVSSKVPANTMSVFSIIVTFLLGLKFIIRPVRTTKETREKVSKKSQIIKSIICGIMVGFICGFVGAGGGMIMLLILTSVLGYDLKTAVGTSTLIMTFTALTGSISHFSIGELPNIWILLSCIVFTFIWARIAAKIANKVSQKTLSVATGVILLALAVVVFIFSLI